MGTRTPRLNRTKIYASSQRPQLAALAGADATARLEVGRPNTLRSLRSAGLATQVCGDQDRPTRPHDLAISGTGVRAMLTTAQAR
ncbi:hypothetical protein GCM10009603_08100 [Nocardiopsis exhalans]